MATDERQAAEARAREILRDADLAQPDEVEYGEACIWLVWHEQKLVIQIDEIPPDHAESAATPAAALGPPDPLLDIPF
jgi:hypothetical protein